MLVLASRLDNDARGDVARVLNSNCLRGRELEAKGVEVDRIVEDINCRDFIVERCVNLSENVVTDLHARELSRPPAT